MKNTDILLDMKGVRIGLYCGSKESRDGKQRKAKIKISSEKSEVIFSIIWSKDRYFYQEQNHKIYFYQNMYEEGKFEILIGLSLDNRASLEQQ